MQFDPLEVGTPERILIHSSGLPYRAPASLVQTDLGSQKRQNIRLVWSPGRRGRIAGLLGPTLVAGVAIIQVHNRWTRHWPVLVTVMGWFAILAGLVNQANPWRCAKKTRGFIQAGYVDPENLLFVRERIRSKTD